MILRAIHIYDGSRTEILDYEKIIEYISSLIPSVAIDIRPEDLILGDYERISRVFAELRLRDIMKGRVKGEPLPGEIDYELRRVMDKKNRTHGILYDGVLVARALEENIRVEEDNNEHLHIYVTNQLIGSFDDDDRRFHARYAIFSYPCIISVNGIVVAPAKPREYYILKQRLKNLENDEIFDTIIKEQMKGRFIDYDDERLNDIMKGIILQCIFYHETGYPFCEKKECRLYNAHWQEDLVRSQTLEKSSLCPSHLKFIKDNFN